MALQVGSVTVDNSGNVTGSGLTKRIVDAFLAMPDLATLLSSASASSKVTIVKGCAGVAGAIAAAVVAEIQANAEVTVVVSTSDAGLQTLPNPVVAGAATTAPGVNKTLNTKGTVT